MFSVQELRSSTEKELLQELGRARKDLLKIRINVKTKHDKNSSKVKKSRRYVSQISTMLKELKREEQSKELENLKTRA